MKKMKFFNFFICLLCTSMMQAQQLTPFKQGDRVAFVGNSITDGGHYHSYIWLYYMTRFPNQRIDMFNVGIGGDTSLDILNRIDSDAFGKHPNVLTLTFGMNDSGYSEYGENNDQKFADKRVDEAQQHFSAIIEKLKTHSDVRMVMIGTSPYDETSAFNNNILHGKNAVINRMIDLQRHAANQYGWEFVDFNGPMCDISSRIQQTQPSFTLSGGDRIHPDNDGHMLMACIFLQAQGMQGRKISSVKIDTKKRKVISHENCEVNKLNIEHQQVEFDYLAHSLPYPLDTIARGWGFKRAQNKIIDLDSNFMKDYNNEFLSVKGLKGSYVLTIDTMVIDTLSAVSLEQGVNLAEYLNTPQNIQAAAIRVLNEERWEVERRFRDFAWLKYGILEKNGIYDTDGSEALSYLQKNRKSNGWIEGKMDLFDKMRHSEVRQAYQQYIDSLVDKIYSVNRPVVHKMVLRQLSKK